jgi:tRNA pseudouridine32 synthase/23S rRNA pseudouridine746 synthase
LETKFGAYGESQLRGGNLDAVVKAVEEYLNSHPELRADADKGKMFGVLLVDGDTTDVRVHKLGEFAFLAAYSGLLAGRNDWEWFVPPVFDAQQPGGHFKRTERAISSINDKIKELEESLVEEERRNKESRQAIDDYRRKMQAAKVLRDTRRLHHNLSPEEEAALIRESQFMKAELHRMKKRLAEATPIADELEDLRRKRREMSEDLQRWLFSQYKLLNYKGEEKTVLEIFYPQLPPAATGDCCAPKLLQYAYAHGLKPLQLTEFWWGESPKQEIRHHLHFYPPCKGRCIPLMRWMLGEDGMKTLNIPNTPITPITPTIIFEDPQIAVIVKPAGMLSVLGKSGEVSVYDVMRQRYPNTDSPLIVHRLDQATSGIMVIAKTLYAYHNLQKQFSEHTIEKRYVAVLENQMTPTQPPRGEETVLQRGEISLPLRPDLNDRPRQVVDYEHGKPAITKYEVVNSEFPTVYLYPQTGRTHQLRVHCAHKDGLNNPILGDTLYGSKKAERLYLHADKITFTHPTTGERVTFSSHVPF